MDCGVGGGGGAGGGGGRGRLLLHPGPQARRHPPTDQEGFQVNPLACGWIDLKTSNIFTTN